MSDYWLRLIPTDPKWLPHSDARDNALLILKTLLPRADEVTVKATDNVAFIDPGSSLEVVRCPSCGSDLDGWWQDAVSNAYTTKFADLAAVTPCCEHATSLNELVWKPAAGFARFALEARNPNIGGSLPKQELSRVEDALGCTLRQVYAHL
jgi:hypothetical protein